MPSGAVKQLAARKAGGWSPLDLPGLVAWWDASDTSTITASGSDVTAWADKSSNGLDLAAEDATKPKTGLVTQNGLNVLSGFATGTNMRLSSSASIQDGTQTWYVACKASDVTGRSPVSLGPRTTGGISLAPYLNATGNRFRMFQGGTEISAANTTTLPFVILWHMKWTSGASAKFRAVVNGTDVDGSGSVGSVTPGSTERVVVGALSRTSTGTEFNWVGSIFEIIMSTDLHDDDTRDTVLDYLADKWGTT
jgi:hypothetical protein